MRLFTTLFVFAILTLSIQLFAAEQSTENTPAQGEALASAPAPAPAEDKPLSAEKVHETKCVFLYCSLISSETMLGGDDAAICSINFELLKAKVFGGSFAKVMEFWQANKTREAYQALCKPNNKK